MTKFNKQISKATTKSSDSAFTPVLVVIEFFKDNEKLRGFSFDTDRIWIDRAGEFCEEMNVKSREEIHHFLVDESGKYNTLFQNTTYDELDFDRDSEINDAFLEYGDKIHSYLGCFKGVSKFLERPEIEYFSISISIDVSDETKTRITGSFFKDGDGEQDIDYPLN
jgi:hypothetical protein